MRVLLFTTAYRPLIGGSEIAIEQIARRLPDVFFDIITQRYSRDFRSVESAGNVRVFRVGLGTPVDKWFLPVLGAFKALRLMGKNRYGLVHAYQASFGAGAAWVVRMVNTKVPLILTLQEGKQLAAQNFLVRSLRALIIKRADRITVISRYLKQYVQTVCPDALIDIVPNGVDFSLFSRPVDAGELEAVRNRFALASDDWVFVSVSRLVAKNGLANLIRAFASIRAVHHAKLLLIGDGPQRNELEALIRSYNLQHQILFAGSVDYKNLPTYLAVANVFVRPSLSEGFGNAFIEAMAAGVPVLASSAGGIADFLVDGQTGVFCDPLSPDDIGEKMSKLINDSELREKLIVAGRALVESKYDWRRISADMHVVYKEAAAKE